MCERKNKMLINAKLVPAPATGKLNPMNVGVDSKKALMGSLNKIDNVIVVMERKRRCRQIIPVYWPYCCQFGQTGGKRVEFLDADIGRA